MKRRPALLALMAATALTLAHGPALADGPTVKILVGFPAGGSSDAIARHLAQGLQQELGRNVVVENKPGAGGQIAAQTLKGAKPDGTTLFLSNSHTVAMIPLTLNNPGFDTAKDFTPVAMVAVNPDVFVVNTQVIGNPSAGMKEFAAWVKANPGKGNVGVPAPASAPDFAVGVVAKALGLDLKSAPYRGDAPIVQDVMAGQIPAGIGSVGAMSPPAKAGKLPTPEQHAELRRLLNEAMDAGACGWSAQRMLPTGPAAAMLAGWGLPDARIEALEAAGVLGRWPSSG